ncbi:sulfur carrier protein ThiS [Psychromicrobium xiongbiense]|uniref:sulfur carrier protein ThiS n=1 Tax=Psychromicrobium xiongbiense TaxID=3051184 RepID=UPI002556008C|nr:sulfur carrier protein ThiS [Psychromicrobium sp. YIM S02556]
MNITVNGEATELPDGLSVLELVARHTGRALESDGTASDGGRLGVAIALAGDVVPRVRWASTVLSAGSDVDLVTAVQGG